MVAVVAASPHQTRSIRTSPYPNRAPSDGSHGRIGRTGSLGVSGTRSSGRTCDRALTSKMLALSFVSLCNTAQFGSTKPPRGASLTSSWFEHYLVPWYNRSIYVLLGKSSMFIDLDEATAHRPGGIEARPHRRIEAVIFEWLLWADSRPDVCCWRSLLFSNRYE